MQASEIKVQKKAKQRKTKLKEKWDQILILRN